MYYILITPLVIDTVYLPKLTYFHTFSVNFVQARKLKEESKCEERVCLAEFDPVCGFNPCERSYKTKYRTFGNDCQRNGTFCDGPGKCNI